jgi:hypothetical protein
LLAAGSNGSTPLWSAHHHRRRLHCRRPPCARRRNSVWRGCGEGIGEWEPGFWSATANWNESELAGS